MNARIEIKNVSKSFKKSDANELLVLDNVNFNINDNEVIALLGKSGSGKSTLLRLIAGLVTTNKGEIVYQGEAINSPVQGIAMVFQSFALMPWLTVLENVEIGLEALGVPRAERRKRALKAIDTIGLDGFESAYPKELSGGMRQRVGFARALVVEPDILLLDEPFSALDVLTAENLKSDLLELWHEKKTKTNSILLVTHNIEEAVYMADRILIMGADPGCIHEDIKVSIPHPRNNADDDFKSVVDRIYTIMTTARGKKAKTLFHEPKFKSIGSRLPDVNIEELVGFLEEMAEPEHERQIDLPKLADDLHLDFDDLSPILELLEALQFARVSGGDIELTYAGRKVVEADILERKQLFAENLVRHIPLLRHIKIVLDERYNHRAHENRFITELEDHLSEEEAERVFNLVISWARYAELFAYDVNSGTLSLENPGDED